MIVFKCKACGANLDVTEGQRILECSYCGTKQTLPRLGEERIRNLYDRANHLRRNNDFDRAMTLYEQILSEENTDAEVYWSIALCRYGVEYVEDPDSHKQIFTIHRTQTMPITADEDYKKALAYADSEQRVIYEAEAKAITRIQEDILAVSEAEEPFDVFLCYKEADQDGSRTQDSVLANEIYNQLVQEGFRVFFSRITLEDKFGSAYEPYIFAALKSAKVMIVLGTKPEYFQAIWVKNEWSRYLAFIKNGAKKILIPAYRDMDPYDLPKEFAYLQALNMGQPGFMQDLIRGVKKMTGETEEQNPVLPNTSNMKQENDSIAPLLKRIDLFLKDQNWSSAVQYAERVLDKKPQNAQAYLAKLMAEMRVTEERQLKNCKTSFQKNSNYIKALRFGDKELKKRLQMYNQSVQGRLGQKKNQHIYENAQFEMECAVDEEDYKRAAGIFRKIAGYRDSEELADICLKKAEETRLEEIYQNAIKGLNSEKLFCVESAIQQMETILDYKDAKEQIEQGRKKTERLIKEKKITKIVIGSALALLSIIILCLKVIVPAIQNHSQYTTAKELFAAGEIQEAGELFAELGGEYKDSAIYIDEIADQYWEQEKWLDALRLLQRGGRLRGLAEKNQYLNRLYYTTLPNVVIGRTTTGNVYCAGELKELSWDSAEVERWTGIKDILAHEDYILGLKQDGTVLMADGKGNQKIDGWNDIVEIDCADGVTVGLKSDGTVVARGKQEDGACDVKDWSDMIQVKTKNGRTVGLKADGRVVATGANKNQECEVRGWRNIEDIILDSKYTIGITKKGKLEIAGAMNEKLKSKISKWDNLVCIYFCREDKWDDLIVGLTRDGTVVYASEKHDGQMEWTDIVSLSCGYFNHYSSGYQCTIGLKADGTVVGKVRFDWGVKSNMSIDERLEGSSDMISVSNNKNSLNYNGLMAGLKKDGSVIVYMGIGKAVTGAMENWNLFP